MLFFKKKPKKTVTLFNTKSRSIEVFEPLRAGRVSMYSCGPTVYDYAHVGNLRSFLFSDIIRRVCEYAGYDVKQVINITDFGHLVNDADDTEDKMMLALKREGKEVSVENMLSLARHYEDAFRDDIQALGIKTPHVLPRASEHVRGMIAYVETLLAKDYAYKTSDGVYFDTEKWEEYGALGGSASKLHSRIGVSGEKRSPADFALWKFNPEMGWDAPWGKGFPGWHIECTAMATEHLGKSFDIHTGGIDHIGVHHNNEIAQAEAANRKPYARYWLHNEFVTVDAKRIGKSEGNAITLKQLSDKGIPPLAYRYWLLTGHYRAPLNFSWEAVTAAQKARERALRVYSDLKGSGTINDAYRDQFEAALFDDLNTPQAIAVMWELIKDETVSGGDKKKTLELFDTVLGIGFKKSAPETATRISVREDALPQSVQDLVAARESARAAKDFAEGDRLRDAINEAGYDIKDTEAGPVLSPRA